MKPDTPIHRAIDCCSRPKIISFLSVLLLVAGLLAAIMVRAHDKHVVAGLWMESLDLSLPAFWPSGTPLRHPLAAVPAVDLRYSPLIPDGRDLVIDSIGGIAVNRWESRP